MPCDRVRTHRRRRTRARRSRVLDPRPRTIAPPTNATSRHSPETTSIGAFVSRSVTAPWPSGSSESGSGIRSAGWTAGATDLARTMGPGGTPARGGAQRVGVHDCRQREWNTSAFSGAAGRPWRSTRCGTLRGLQPVAHPTHRHFPRTCHGNGSQSVPARGHLPRTCANVVPSTLGGVGHRSTRNVGGPT